MRKNKPIGNNARGGAVKNRFQVTNTKTRLFIKRDSITGKFIDNKTSGGKFNGIKDEN